MQIIIGIAAAIIGFILLKHGAQMAVMHPKHSAFTYRLAGVVCLITVALCIINTFGILKT